MLGGVLLSGPGTHNSPAGDLTSASCAQDERLEEPWGGTYE